jgi:hypothetical protein
VAAKARLCSRKEMVAARCQIRAASRMFKISTGSVAEVEFYFTAIKFIFVCPCMSLIYIMHKYFRRLPFKGLLSV